MIDKKSLALGMALGRWNLLKTGGVGLFAVRQPGVERRGVSGRTGRSETALSPRGTAWAEGWMYKGQLPGREGAAFALLRAAAAAAVSGAEARRQGCLSLAGAAAAGLGPALSARIENARMECDPYA